MSTSGSFGLKKLAKERGSLGIFDITNDTDIKLAVANAGPSNTVGVYGKIQGQDNYSLIDTIIGNSTKLINVSYYDFLDIEIITYDSLSNYVDIAGSGFIAPLSANNSGGVVSGDVNVKNFPDPQNVAVINTPSVYSPDLVGGTPTVNFVTLNNANVEYSITLPVNTKKFLIKVTNNGASFRVGFISGGDKFSIARGCSYSEEMVKLIAGKNTIYLSSPKNNVTVECLSWA